MGVEDLVQRVSTDFRLRYPIFNLLQFEVRKKLTFIIEKVDSTTLLYH